MTQFTCEYCENEDLCDFPVVAAGLLCLHFSGKHRGTSALFARHPCSTERDDRLVGSAEGGDEILAKSESRYSILSDNYRSNSIRTCFLLLYKGLKVMS